eukprot:CAMPEP_0172313816 /NCGR_PEP_ID=MMETSP1058-20130122/21038_1 /TAXON_ID=83371 /ORGANISM="Detonula confervacea, Strain CCMP 353" /LENGTH=420 /DNA_ID=CAMNT_0013027531 /DNA_START=9 /DNA_END=1272 /DNA_ORIENTATION=+
MKHSNSLLALLTLAASNNEAGLHLVSAKKVRTRTKNHQADAGAHIRQVKQPTAAPSYNPTEWPTFYPTTVAEKTPRPTKRPNKKPTPPPTKSPNEQPGTPNDVVPPPLVTSPLRPNNLNMPPLTENGLVVAFDDVINLPPGTEEAFIGVLENDTGSNLIVRSVDQASFGTCTISISLSEVVYSNTDPSFIGSDTCTYEACDDEDDCDTATLTVVFKEETTSDPTFSDTIRSSPPTVDSGTSQTLSPTEGIDRLTPVPTRRPITPFPTEEEIDTEVPTVGIPDFDSISPVLSYGYSSDYSADGYLDHFKSGSGSGSGSGSWSGSKSGKSGSGKSGKSGGGKSGKSGGGGAGAATAVVLAVNTAGSAEEAAAGAEAAAIAAAVAAVGVEAAAIAVAGVEAAAIAVVAKVARGREILGIDCLF